MCFVKYHGTFEFRSKGALSPTPEGFQTRFRRCQINHWHAEQSQFVLSDQMWRMATLFQTWSSLWKGLLPQTQPQPVPETCTGHVPWLRSLCYAEVFPGYWGLNVQCRSSNPLECLWPLDDKEMSLLGKRGRIYYMLVIFEIFIDGMFSVVVCSGDLNNRNNWTANFY